MRYLLVLIAVFLVSCSDSSQETKDFSIKEKKEYIKSKDFNENKNVYFGDLHVHTKHSFDAFIFGTTNTPDDAYKYAKGGTIQHPLGFDMKLRQPLDFYAVTDHGFFMGMMPAWADPNSKPGQHPYVKTLHNVNRKENLTVESSPERLYYFRELIRSGAFAELGSIFSIIKAYLTNNNSFAVDVFDYDTHKSAWSDVANAAERHYEPGKFTTFIAYEFTASTEGMGNLHRNVIFGSSKAPIRPYSRIDSLNPEDLWNTMDKWRENGIDSIAIPHNSNGSNGRMFEIHQANGAPMDTQYLNQRIRNEPIVEITQVKGTSETHPLLSPNDEWSDFEIMSTRVGSVPPTYSRPDGSYVRDALKKGLMLEQFFGGNPYNFGFIGSSDTHTGASSFDESNYFSKVGILDGTPVGRGSIPIPQEQLDFINNLPDEQSDVYNYVDYDGQKYMRAGFDEWGASGIAAVWAEENTREAIFSAFKRKETYATSGNRILLRFFGGFDLGDIDLNSSNLISELYERSVPMGGNIINSNNSIPNFIIWTKKGINGAHLQRVQIVKGWIDDRSAEPFEKVYDVACSDGQEVDQVTQRCPDNGARVNISDCSISADVGDKELKTFWSDPDFDPDLKAFYYVRVLENPTCRWSTWDALRAGTNPRKDLKPTIQERAWSSPIWYIP